MLALAAITYMSTAAISPSLPEMSTAFQNEYDAEFIVKLVLTTPALFIAISAPLVGVFIDRWGRKRLFVISIILYAIAGGSGYFLNSLLEILVSRALLGIAVAGIITTSTALIVDYFVGVHRNKVMGLQAAFGTFGGVIFLLVGGFLADISWRTPFLIYLLAFVMLPLVMYFIYEPQLSRSKDKVTQKGKVSKVKITYLVYPIVFLSMVIIFLTPVQMPFYLKQLGDVSNTEVGIAIASSYLLAGITALFYKRIKSRQSFQNISIIAFLLMGSGYVIISLALNYLEIIIGLAVSGAGLGLLLPNMNLWLVSETPITLRGRVLGGLIASIFLGQFLSPVFNQPVVQQLGSSSTFGVGGFILLILSSVFIGMSVKKKFETGTAYEDTKES
ncbi:MAG: MFS transporter [Nitrososphaerales archaeon]